MPGRAIKGSINEDKYGRLTFDGEFSTSKHPNGTSTPDKEEKAELKKLLDREKPAVDELDKKRYGQTRENVRKALRAAREALLRRLGTCEVALDGPDDIAEGQFGKFTADGLPSGGSYTWAPTVQQDLGGLYGVQQAYGETTLRADSDSGTAGVSVVYRVGKCQASAFLQVQLTK